MKILLLALALSSTSINANVGKNLDYPAGELNATTLAEQLYFVNHYFYLSSLPLKFQLKGMNIVVNKSPKKKARITAIERYLDNTNFNKAVKSKELAIFRSGPWKGRGMLITEFNNKKEQRMYQLWMPSTRKVRRFATPDINDQWIGTQLTNGDAHLRRVEHESHIVLGTEKFEGCLNTIKLQKRDYNKWLRQVPVASCNPEGRTVYKLKSKSLNESDYDYRISYIDVETFADYRTIFYKNGEKIKTIDKDWHSMGMEDPRIMYWGYWYIKNHQNNLETYILMSPENMKYSHLSNDRKLWSERFLSKMKM